MAVLDKAGLTHFWGRLKATFVRVADIANNLTTTASGKALDARQGKALNDAIATKVSKAGDVMTGHLNIGIPEETEFKVVGVRRTVNGVAGQTRLGVGMTSTNPGVTLELLLDGTVTNALYVRDTYATFAKPLNVTGGGTNANNPTDARNNLGLKSGATTEILTGTATITLTGTAKNSVQISFGSAFSATPKVAAIIETNAPGSVRPIITFASRSATGVTFWASKESSDTVAYPINWIAVN